jgi:hypothetical protein
MLARAIDEVGYLFMGVKALVATLLQRLVDRALQRFTRMRKSQRWCASRISRTLHPQAPSTLGPQDFV